MREVAYWGFYIPDEIEQKYKHFTETALGANRYRNLGIHFRSWGLAYGIAEYEVDGGNKPPVTVVIRLHDGAMLEFKSAEVIRKIHDNILGLQEQLLCSYQQALDEVCHLAMTNQPPKELTNNGTIWRTAHFERHYDYSEFE